MPKKLKSLEEKSSEKQTNGLDDSATNSALNNSNFPVNHAHLDRMHVSTDFASSDRHEHRPSDIDSDTLLEEIGYSENMKEIEKAEEEKENVVAKDPDVEASCQKPAYKFPNLWPKTSHEALLFDDNEHNLNIPDSSCDVVKNSENDNQDSSISKESVLKVESVLQMNTKPAMKFHTHSKPELSNHAMQVHENSVNKYDTESKDIQELENGYLQEAFEQKDDYVISHPPPPHFAASQDMDKYTSPVITEVSKPEMHAKSEMKNNLASSSKGNPLKMKRKISSQNRCGVCNARLGICAIRCRCGNLYCSKHRYDRDHNCTFDYRAMGADEIRKNNPQVIAEKIRKL